jgi:hypothetical protein
MTEHVHHVFDIAAPSAAIMLLVMYLVERHFSKQDYNALAASLENEQRIRRVAVERMNKVITELSQK